MNFADIFLFHAPRHAFTGLAMALGVAGALLAFSAGANAQSFDGVYKGTMRSTEDITLLGGRTHRCSPIGTVGRSEFRVAGSTITVTTPAGPSSRTVGNDGRFSIVAAARGPYGGGSREWKGTVAGSRIEGTFQLQAGGFICRSVFSAKK